MSPVVETSVVVLAAAYGFFAIYLASVHPFVVLTTADIRSIPEPITLDTDLWERHENAERGYQYAVPPGWIVDDADPGRVVSARARGRLPEAREGGEGLMIEVLELGPRQEPENVAVADFAGRRPALYDVSVYGQGGLFAIAFEDGRVSRQAVYVPIGEKLYVFRGGKFDPAAFSAFVSTVRFFPQLLLPLIPNS